MSAAFRAIMPFLKLYASYCANYVASLRRLKRPGQNARPLPQGSKLLRERSRHTGKARAIYACPRASSDR